MCILKCINNRQGEPRWIKIVMYLDFLALPILSKGPNIGLTAEIKEIVTILIGCK